MANWKEDLPGWEDAPRQCEHCTEEYGLRGVPCDRGDLPPHCERHREKCARCHTIFCYKALKENEDGEKLCAECAQIEAEPQIQAARRAAHTGSRSARQILAGLVIVTLWLWLLWI